MRMPAPKKRRVDENDEDSFDEELTLVRKDNNPNDDDPMKPGPSVIAEKIGPRSDEGLDKGMSQDISSRQSGNAISSTILTGGSNQSGVEVMLRKRNENLTKQLEDCKREKATKEMFHFQEKKDLVTAHQKELRNLVSQRDQLNRELLSATFRQDNSLSMTIADHNTTLAANTSYVPTRPIERKQGERTPSARVAWINQKKKHCAGTSKVNNLVFKHNIDDTFQHFPTQSMESSTFAPTGISPLDLREEKKLMVSTECQTVEEEKRLELKASKREEIINGLLTTAVMINTENFEVKRLEDLCRDIHHKPLRRNANYVPPSSQDM